MYQSKILVWAINESRPLMETMCAQLLDSASIFGVEAELFGIGIKHTSHKERINLLYNYLKTVSPETVVVCIDGADTLFNDSGAVLLEKFFATETRILVSAEKDFCYQYDGFRNKFDALSSDYKYVNAGTFMGFAGDLFLMLEDIFDLMEKFPQANDQGLLGIWVYQNLERRDLVQLDHNCDIFWVTTKDWSVLKSVAETEQIIANPFTNTTPVIIHVVGNGFAPHRAAYDAAYQTIRRNHGSEAVVIRFPSGKTKEFSDGWPMVKRLVATSVQIAEENLFFVQKEKLLDTEEPVFVEGPIDLMILVEGKYLICAQELEGLGHRLGYFPFIPPEAIENSRSLENVFVQPNFARTFQDFFHQRDDLKTATDEAVAPFYAAYQQHKEKRLTSIKQMSNSLQGDAIVICTFNHPFIALFQNLIASCDQNGIDIRRYCLFFPMDEASQSACQELKVVSMYQDGAYGPSPTNYQGFGHGSYRDCMFMKNAIVQDMLELGHHVLFMDIDLVWLHNPIPYVEQMAEIGKYDYLFMFDGPGGRDRPLHYNTGFFYVRNTSFSRKSWQFIFDHFNVIWQYRSQQAAVNQVLNQYIPGGLRTKVLDPLRFINGHLFVPRYAKFDLIPSDAFVVHASWTAHIDDKIALLKRHNLWYLS